MSFNADLNDLIITNENGLLSKHISWERLPLKKVARIVNGYPFDSRFFNNNNGVQLIRIRDIFKIQTESLYNGPIPDGYWVSSGDIIIGMDGNFDCARWNGSPGLLNQRVCKLDVFSSYVDDRFLFYSLGGYLESINKYTSSVTVKHLSSKTIGEILIPIPPLNEQKRIADKLDALLARVDACRAHLERVPEFLQRFRQAVLAEAVSGRLTEDWRKSNRITTDSWSVKTGKEVFPFITSGSRGWAKYYSEYGSKFIRVGNLSHNSINLDSSDIQYVNLPDSTEGKRTRINMGDILISITADIGRVAYIEHALGEAYINQHICLARQTGDYFGKYLAYYLASPTGGLGQFEKKQRGMTKQGLTLGNIREVSFKIPTYEEQQEIVRRVEILLSYADRLEVCYQAAQAAMDDLTPALLAKAFRGELVPQDPNDEPAELLLDRIRKSKAEKQHAAGKSRRKS